MVQKEEQQRVKALIKETITLLCKNGLKYQSGFCIEATIGITVDENDILLVSMNETIKTELAERVRSLGSTTQGDDELSPPSNRSHRRHKRRRPGRKSVSSASDNDSSNDDSMDSAAISSQTHSDRGPPVKRLHEAPSRPSSEQEDSKSDIMCIEIKEEPDDYDDARTTCQQQTFTPRQPGSQRLAPGGLDFPPSDFPFPSDLSQVSAGDYSGSGLPPGQSSANTSSQDISSIMPWQQPSGGTPGSGPGPSAAAGSSFSSDPNFQQPGTSHSQDQQQIVEGPAGAPAGGQAGSPGQRPSCYICSQTFKQPSSLYRHIRTIHLKVFAHSCKFCQKGFQSISDARAHAVAKHGDLLSPTEENT